MTESGLKGISGQRPRLKLNLSKVSVRWLYENKTLFTHTLTLTHTTHTHTHTLSLSLCLYVCLCAIHFSLADWRDNWGYIVHVTPWMISPCLVNDLQGLVIILSCHDRFKSFQLQRYSPNQLSFPRFFCCLFVVSPKLPRGNLLNFIITLVWGFYFRKLARKLNAFLSIFFRAFYNGRFQVYQESVLNSITIRIWRVSFTFLLFEECLLTYLKPRSF